MVKQIVKRFFDMAQYYIKPVSGV